jgi:CDGSH-type Zn-finger protein
VISAYFSVSTKDSRPEAQILFAAARPGHYKERMNEPIVFQKSPFVQKTEPGSYWWCACGRSKSQPFCDGSHKGSGLSPVKVDIAASGMVAWCGCKQSKNKPFCDGSHSQLG